MGRLMSVCALALCLGGRDYLYPADWFVAVEIPKAVERSLLNTS
jgi:hypothetical protein